MSGSKALGATTLNVTQFARSLMEPVYMIGAEYGRYIAARQPEFTRFITDLGLAGKK